VAHSATTSLSRRIAQYTFLAAAMEKIKFLCTKNHPAFPGPPHAFTSIKTAVTHTHQHDPNRVLGKRIVSQLIKPSKHTPLAQLISF